LYVRTIRKYEYVGYNSLWTKNDKISEGSSMLKRMAERMTRTMKQRRERSTKVAFANVESPAVWWGGVGCSMR
jgi:hypothetical protein